MLEWAKARGDFDVIIPQRSISLVADWEAGVQITGKSDFLFKLVKRNSSEMQLLEVKSIASVDKLDAALKHHVIQIMPYIYTLKPTASSILYVEKDNLSNRKEFFVDYDPMIMSYIMERTKSLHNFLSIGEIPPAEAKYCPKCRQAKLEVVHTTRPKTATCPYCKTVFKGKEIETETILWQCNYCPFRERCDTVEFEREKKSNEASKSSN